MGSSWGVEAGLGAGPVVVLSSVLTELWGHTAWVREWPLSVSAV